MVSQEILIIGTHIVQKVVQVVHTVLLISYLIRRYCQQVNLHNGTIFPLGNTDFVTNSYNV